MTDWLNQMTTDIETADMDAVIRSFDRKIRKLRSKHLLLRGKHWRTIRYHQRRIRENNRKLHAVEKYANELLNSQSPIRQGVGHLLKEMVSIESQEQMTIIRNYCYPFRDRPGICVDKTELDKP